ncbi:MAG: hypothetical protein V7727_01320 [Sneathiella sp.]
MNTESNSDEMKDLDPSELDDLTHAEMLSLYKESTRTMLFAKTRQWSTLGATCLAQLSLVLIGSYVSQEISHFRALIILSFLISSFAIAILLIYQLWQHTETLKIRKINLFMSDHFRLVRQVKSSLEANIHRYILLVTMIGTVGVANTIVYISLVGHIIDAG